MIHFQVGDIFRSHDAVLVHGCNCMNTMGAGIALQVMKRYPGAYDVDCTTIRGDRKKLGNVSVWSGKHFLYDQPITIVNAYTQYVPSVKEKPLDYDALERSMCIVRNMFHGQTICMPKIGAGLGGGDWDKIMGILSRVFEYEPFVTIYLLNPIYRSVDGQIIKGFAPEDAA